MLYFKKIMILLPFCFLAIGLRAQNEVSSATLKNMRGKIVSFGSVTQKDSLVLVCFWATNSELSINQLNAINAVYGKWKEAGGFRLMVVSVDEGKAANKIKPMVYANEWTFDVYLDINGELRNALKSNNLPQSMIIQRNKVIYEQSGYEPGSENYLFHKMQTIAAGKQ
jgi:hypothetical protein